MLSEEATPVEKEPMRLLQQPFDPKQLRRHRPSLRERFRRLSLLKKQAYHHPHPMYHPAQWMPSLDDNSPRMMSAYHPMPMPSCTCCCHQHQPHQPQPQQPPMTPAAVPLYTNIPMVLVPAMHFYPHLPLHAPQPLHPQSPYPPQQPSSLAPPPPHQTMSCPTTPMESYATLPCPYAHYIKEEKQLVDRPHHKVIHEDALDDEDSSDDDNATLRSASSYHV